MDGRASVLDIGHPFDLLATIGGLLRYFRERFLAKIALKAVNCAIYALPGTKWAQFMPELNYDRIDRRILEEESWRDLAAKGFD
jgi:hypothetical protein